MAWWDQVQQAVQGWGQQVHNNPAILGQEALNAINPASTLQQASGQIGSWFGGGGSAPASTDGSSYVGMPTSVLPDPNAAATTTDPHAGMRQLPSGQWVSAADYSAIMAGLGAGTSGYGTSGGMTAYEAATLALDQQKLQAANQQAQDRLAFDRSVNEAKNQYDQSTAVDTFDKNFRDYQKTNYYGSMYGPGYFAPNGAAQPFRAPEPTLVQQYYQNNPTVGPDPFSQVSPYAGYTGSSYVNPQHPGNPAVTQAPIGSPGQQQGGGQPLPLGPELTGASGFGGLVTQNGTPVAPSAYQQANLDPTSLEHYNSYVTDIAGFNPADFKQTGTNETGNVAALAAPEKYTGPTV
jgi:hypothetical protein